MKVFGGVVILVLGYLLVWPVPIAPISWQAPSSSGFSGEFAENNRLAGLSFIELGEDKGPEDFAINAAGTIATATHSGAVLLKKKGEAAFTPWINTGGRPLGIEFDTNGNLLIADAHRGLVNDPKSPTLKPSYLVNF